MFTKITFFVLLIPFLLFSKNRSVLDLDTAVYRTLTSSLTLDIASTEAGARRGQVRQSKLYPNPGFSYEVENFAGNREWRGWKNREERYIWSQLFETAGKRHLRFKAASYQYYAALVGYQASQLMILNRLIRSFIDVIAAQEFIALTQDQTSIAQEVLRVATKKVEAGKVGLVEQTKAEVAYADSLIALKKAEVNLKNAKRRLSLLWNSPCPDFDVATFPFFVITEPVALEDCLAELCHQPEVIQTLYTYHNARQMWRLEKAQRIPDVTLSVGYKGEKDNQGLIAGISVPIPLFNQNQGNIERAYFEMLKTDQQSKQLLIILENKLAISYESLIQAYDEALKLDQNSLPAAKQAFELAQKGYREGKFEYLDVLDAQRTLFYVREKYIQALINYHHRRADIDYLNSQVD